LSFCLSFPKGICFCLSFRSAAEESASVFTCHPERSGSRPHREPRSRRTCGCLFCTVILTLNEVKGKDPCICPFCLSFRSAAEESASVLFARHSGAARISVFFLAPVLRREQGPSGPLPPHKGKGASAWSWVPIHRSGCPSFAPSAKGGMYTVRPAPQPRQSVTVE